MERTSAQNPKSFLVVVMTLIVSLACSPLSALSLGDSSDCTDLELASSSAKPGDPVRLSGLPPWNDQPYAEVSTDSQKNLTTTLVIPQAKNGWAVVAPLHPDGIGGGKVSVLVTDGEHRCPARQLTIEPIPPAPGTFDRYVTALADYLGFWRASVGVTRQQLLEEHIPNSLVPLAVVQELYDGPDNPDSLVRIAAGESSQDVDFQVLDAALASTSLLQELNDLEVPGNEMGAGSGPRLAAPSAQQSAAQQLSDDMERQQSCQDALTGSSGDVINNAELTMTAVGVVSGGAGLALSAVWLAAKWPLEYCAYMLPSKFTTYQIELTPTEFLEDTDFQTNPGVVKRVSVSGESEGWNVTGIAIDTLLAAGGGADLAKGVEAGFVGTANGALASTVNNVCGRSDCSGDISATIPPQPFSDIDINWPAFVKFTPLRSITSGDGFGLYQPVDTGPGGLRVETLPVFGDATLRKSIEMDVKAIEVSLTPHAVTLKPGESATFNVGITDSEHPEVNRWVLIAPGGAESPIGDNLDSFTFTAPRVTHDVSGNKCEKKEVWGVQVDSTTETGLRADHDPVRRDVATIEVVEKKQDDPTCATPTPSPTPDPDKCLLGSWSVDPASYLVYLQSLVGSPDITVAAADGVMTLDFASDWSLAINTDMDLTFSTSQGSITTHLQESGTRGYSVDVASGRLTVTGGTFLTASIGGVSQSSPTDSGSAPYTCDAKTLTVQVSGLPPIRWNREP